MFEKLRAGMVICGSGPNLTDSRALLKTQKLVFPVRICSIILPIRVVAFSLPPFIRQQAALLAALIHEAR